MKASEFVVSLELPEEMYVLTTFFADRAGLTVEDFVVQAVKKELLESMNESR